MAKENKDRRWVYCLQCFKPSQTLATHLARVCMKANTPAERQRELERAKESTKSWTREARVWDYGQICHVIPHGPSRHAVVKEMKRRGFLILNDPMDIDLEEVEPRTSGEAAEQPSTSGGPLPTAEDQACKSSPVQTSEEEVRDPTWQPSTPNFSTPLRVRMQEKNLYAKFPPETTELVKFKHHLVSVLQISNCQQEVDNVSRILRYLQPTGNQVMLDFLDSKALVEDFFTALKRVGQTAATRINYIKSLTKFVQYLRLERGGLDPAFHHKCTHYLDFLSVLRIPIAKTHTEDLCSKRHQYFAAPKTTVHECQRVLREAKKDVLGIYGRLLKKEQVTEEEKTQYRYFCEAILLLGHFQRPGGVEGLTVTEWLAKQECNGRVVVAVEPHKTPNRQVAPFALTQEESALIEQYYLSVRPDCIREGANEDDDAHHLLFLASNGRPVKSATNDLRRLHEHYKLPNITSKEIRRAVWTEANSTFSNEQKTGLACYLAQTDKLGNNYSRMREPGRIVETANLVRRITNSSDGSDDRLRSGSKRGREDPDEDNFERFAKLFPVTLDGTPPSKRQRSAAGFSADRVLYDKWRAQQFKLREEHLLTKWSRRPPTVQNIEATIQKEQWLSNCPTAQAVAAKWSPPEKEDVETNTSLMKFIQKQKWKHLAVVEPSPKTGEGKGVVTTKSFPKNAIICDYHGELISGAEGRRRMANRSNQTDYCFFFKAGTEDLCIDSHIAPCCCHPDTETLGRLINHSKKKANVKPVVSLMQFPDGPKQVLLFKASRDLKVNEELLLDYGVRKK